MPHVHAQIDALREAFSADTSKPFVLKRSFPYSSPSVHTQKSLSGSPQYLTQPRSESSLGGSQQLEYLSQPISPPLSTGGLQAKGDSPSIQAPSMLTVGQPQDTQAQMTNTVPMVDAMSWNPSRIFEYVL